MHHHTALPIMAGTSDRNVPLHPASDADWTFFLQTFGCKVNQYETQALREAWARCGGREVHDPTQAAWIVLNTCAVTAQAVSAARQAVHRLHRAAPRARILVTGCSASAAGHEFAALPGVAAVVEQTHKDALLNGPLATAYTLRQSAAAQAQFQTAAKAPTKIKPGTGPSTEPDITPDFPTFQIESFVRARPVLKVQDGCSHHCTYCIVPLTRGSSRSRAPSEVLAEARRLLANGHREIMISGINLHQYHSVERSGEGDFWDLLAMLDAALSPEWQGQARLRLSSLDPSQLNDKAGATLAQTRMVCPHLHLSLQSGSPDVLRRMGRGHYDPARILAQVETISQCWPMFGLGADVLMGFPGEMPHHCQETLDVLEALPLTYAHVFPFSPRPGTAAARMSGQLPIREKQRRAALARAIIRRKHSAFLTRMLDCSTVLVAPDVPSNVLPETTPDTLPAQPLPASLLKGINEYYVSCHLTVPCPDRPDSHNLISAHPVGIVDDLLLVAPLPH